MFPGSSCGPNLYGSPCWVAGRRQWRNGAEVRPLSLSVRADGVPADARYENEVVRNFIPAALARVQRCVREPGVPTHSVAQRQLPSGAPSVLEIVEHPFLAVLLVCRDLCKPLETARIAQEEAGKPAAGAGVVRRSRHAGVEVVNTCTVVVTRKAQVLGGLYFRSPLDHVIAGRLRPVRNPLENIFDFIQRAIAPVTHNERPGAVDVKVRQSSTARKRREIDPRNPNLLREILVDIQWKFIDSVTVGPEPKVAQQRRTENVIDAQGAVQQQAVGLSLVHVDAGRRDLRSTIQPECSGRNNRHAGVAESPKVIQFVIHVVVNANIKLISVKVIDA